MVTCVAISRASHEATVLTDDANRLGQRLVTEVGKTSALETTHAGFLSRDQGIGNTI